MTGRRPASVLVGILAGVCLAAVGSTVGARAAGPTNDYFWDHPPVQWGLLQVGAPAAWTASTGAGAVVGVVDSGVDAVHEDLAGKVLAGADCVGASGDPSRCGPGGTTDPVGHGTHVAGIIAAITNNGLGVAGMAPDARLVVARAVNSDGSGTDGDVAAGIAWVVDHGATVVNLSLGAEGTSNIAFGPGFAAGARYAWSHGAIPVVAAGNAAATPDYGNLDVVVVAATTPTGEIASYSNQLGGAKWGVVAPGGAADGNPYDDIVSTYPGNRYATIAGTSMAAAHVSGALALLRAEGLSRDDAVQRLTNTAVSCGGCGHGRIDAAAAAGTGTAPPPASVAPPPAEGGSTSPGHATFVGPSARTRPAAGSAPRSISPRPTSPSTIPVTAAPTTTATAAPAPAADGSLALADPWPGRVGPDGTTTSGSSSSPSRLLPLVLAFALLLGMAAAVAVLFRQSGESRGRRRGT